MSKDGIKIGYDFTPFPDAIWDENIDLSLGEFRLLGYLLKQVKFGQTIDPVSDEDLIKGRFDSETNERDKGCGLTSRNGIKQARELLLLRKWIDAVNVSDDPSRPKWLYKVRLKGEGTGVTARQVVSQRDSTVSQRDSTVSQRDTKDIRSIDTRDSRDNTHVLFEENVSNLKDSLGLQEKPNYEFQANQIYAAYPRKVGRAAAIKAIIRRLKEGIPYERLLERTYTFAKSPAGQNGQYTPHAETWFNRESYNDDEKEWHKNGKTRDQQRNSNNRESFTATAESHGLTKLGGGIPALQQRVLPRVSGNVANDHDSEERESESDSEEFPKIL